MADVMMLLAEACVEHYVLCFIVVMTTIIATAIVRIEAHARSDDAAD